MKIQANACKMKTDSRNRRKIQGPGRQGWPSPARPAGRCLARKQIRVICLQSSEEPLGSHREPQARSPHFSKKSKEPENFQKKSYTFFWSRRWGPCERKREQGVVAQERQVDFKMSFPTTGSNQRFTGIFLGALRSPPTVMRNLKTRGGGAPPRAARCAFGAFSDSAVPRVASGAHHGRVW